MKAKAKFGLAKLRFSLFNQIFRFYDDYLCLRVKKNCIKINKFILFHILKKAYPSAQKT